MGLFQWLWKGRKNALLEHSEQRLVAMGDRNYVEDAPYMLPKDDQEIDRLDLQHYMLRSILQENYLAPLKMPKRILDIGCGTGRWAIEVAEAFPTADIVGLDIVKPTLEVSQRPNNVLFLQRDVLKGLPFTDKTFDYVHMRFLIGALPVTDFQNVVNEMSRVVQPGGWIELAEPGLLINTGIGLGTIWEWLVAFARMRNIDITQTQRIARFLKEAQLVNISYKEVTMPVGEYAGQIGRISARNILALAEAIRAPIVSLKIASTSDYNAMLTKAKAELEQANGNCYAKMHIAIAQRKA